MRKRQIKKLQKLGQIPLTKIKTDIKVMPHEINDPSFDRNKAQALWAELAQELNKLECSYCLFSSTTILKDGFTDAMTLHNAGNSFELSAEVK